MKSMIPQPLTIIKMAFILIAMGLVGCFRLYYQTSSMTKTDAVHLEQLLKQDKIFIVHSAADVFKMELVKIDGDHLTRDSVSLPIQEISRVDMYSPDKVRAELQIILCCFFAGTHRKPF